MTAPKLKLLPCPFCGGRASESREVYDKAVACRICGANSLKVGR